MFNSDPPERVATDEQALERVVAGRPYGALMVAGVATALVVAIWLVFYLFVFMPRGALQ